jgi:hypothetical protein
MEDYGVSRNERFANERDKLLPIPKERYELAEWKEPKVHPDCCVQIVKNFYSVPYTLVGQRLRARVGDKTIQIYTEELELVANHPRLRGVGKSSIYDEHYPPAQLAASRFELQSIKRRASQVGPKMREYVELQISGDRTLRHLRRLQGVLALLSKNGVTYEAWSTLQRSRLHLAATA